MQPPEPPGYSQAMQDAEHLKLLSIFHYVLAAFGALIGCFPIIHIVLGAAMVSGAFLPGASSSHPPGSAGWLFILMGGMMCLLSWGWAVCLFMAGRKLAARRSWTFCFVIACISCAGFPLGTILGVFTIMVLSRPPVKLLFGRELPGGYLNR